MWHILGEDLIKAIKSFLKSGRLLKELNHTSITLVPKVQNPSKLNEFRPISCCNIIYKCISGILAKRLKALLPKHIDQAQTTFIPRRNISDNILIAQEILRNYHRGDTTSRFVVKVDLFKAFDTLNWSFLLDLLYKLGFPPKFVGWIRECITTPKFSVNINGELVGFFWSSRGLRQGDPISSYLFVIAIDALSMLIHKRVDSDNSFKYHWRCERTKLTHLCFADDLMIFCGNSIQSATTLQLALHEFSNLSGLIPNKSKSNTFVAGNNIDFKNIILSLFEYDEGTLTVRYLGAPLITTKLSTSDCKPLINDITSIIKSWTSRFLSFAGRLQLIQSVIYNIQSFWNGLFILPKKVLKQVEQIMRKSL